MPNLRNIYCNSSLSQKFLETDAEAYVANRGKLESGLTKKLGFLSFRKKIVDDLGLSFSNDIDIKLPQKFYLIRTRTVYPSLTGLKISVFLV